MHRVIYLVPQAWGSLRRVAKIGLVDTSNGEKSPSGFRLNYDVALRDTYRRSMTLTILIQLVVLNPASS